MIHENIFIIDSQKYLYENNQVRFKLDRYYTIKHAEITFIAIPNSDYIIDEYNNKLSFEYDNIKYTIKIDVGNYSIEEYIDELQEKINDLCSEYNLDINFNIKFDYVTDKLTINADKDFKLIIDNDEISKLTGFIKKEYDFSNTFTANNKINFTLTHFYKIKINEFKNTIFIPNDCAINEILVHNKSEKLYPQSNNQKINEINITIYNDKNKIVNFRGLNYTILLKILE